MQRLFLLNINIKQIIFIILGGSFIYLLANFFLTIAWKQLLKWFGEDRINFKESVRIYGQSQILKYIPGNVFYLPGRHLLGRRIGLDHGPMVGAATFEILGIISASSFFSIIGFYFSQNNNGGLPLLVTSLVLIITLSTPLIAKNIFTRRHIFQKLSVFQSVSLGNYPRLILTWLAYLTFFAITGIILFWTIRVVQGTRNNVPLSIVFSSYAVSWFLGFITPGAPAGVGVRDGIIVLTLSNFIGESNSILVSVIMRAITTLGDVYFYILSLLLGFFKSETVYDDGQLSSINNPK